MRYILKNHNYNYETQSLIQIFFKNSKFQIDNNITENFTVYTKLKSDSVYTAIYVNKKIVIEKTEKILDDEKYTLKKCLFLTLREYTNFYPKWGMFTGIRPIKKINHLKKVGYSNEEIKQELKNKYFVAEDKITLALKIAENQQYYVTNINDNFYSLYINIPFCYSKCSYCSFTSFSYEKYKKEKKAIIYLQHLFKEMQITKELMGDKKLKSIYIGGGTPTSLDEIELETLLKFLKDTFDVDNLEEFTVEAGRADTITENKLILMKKFGVSRISINAQTLKDDTLKKIGRNHTAKDFFSTFNLARKVGHNNINVDVIVGLIDENICDVENTVSNILKLKPENITIHTLAIKKGSTIRETKIDDDGNYEDNIQYEQLKTMLEKAYDIIDANNYEPYYLYRQKNMLGNFENVGFAINKKYSYYNIHIMEEKQTIMAVGAGASSKIVNLQNDLIKTVFNLKGVEEYIKRFDEMIERKRESVINAEQST